MIGGMQLRCQSCGTDLWDVERYVRAGGVVACERCLRTMTDALAATSLYDEAEVQLRKEIQLNPQTALPYIRLASIELTQHQSADAIGIRQCIARGDGRRHRHPQDHRALYLQMVEQRFGTITRAHVAEMSKHRLRRLLLEEASPARVA